MDAFQKSIEQMSPENYARAAKRSAALSARLSAQSGIELSKDILRICNTSEEDLVIQRRQAIKDRARSINDVIDDLTEFLDDMPPDHPVRVNLSDFVNIVYDIDYVIVRRDALHD